MRRKKNRINLWNILPREKRFRKSHIRVTKYGVQFVEGHLHDYPVNPFKDIIRPKERGRTKSKVKEMDLRKRMIEEKERYSKGMNCMI